MSVTTVTVVTSTDLDSTCVLVTPKERVGPKNLVLFV